MPTRNSNERAAKREVKPGMDRVKVALIALFPAFLLLASGQALRASGGNCPATGSCNASCTLDSGGHCPLHPCCASQVSARTAGPRLVKHLGKTNPPALTSFFSSPALALSILP